MLLIRDTNTTQKEILGEKKPSKKIYKTDGNKKTSSVTTLYQTKQNSKQKEKGIKRNKEDIFQSLKRCNYPGNYNMNPNVTSKLPELHKARTGTSTKKRRKFTTLKGDFKIFSTKMDEQSQMHRIRMT